MDDQNEPTAAAASSAAYERDLARARDEGTDILERTDDLPPPDHYGAARDLVDLLVASGEDMNALVEEIGIPGADPAL